MSFPCHRLSELDLQRGNNSQAGGPKIGHCRFQPIGSRAAGLRGLDVGDIGGLGSVGSMGSIGSRGSTKSTGSLSIGSVGFRVWSLGSRTLAVEFRDCTV